MFGKREKKESIDHVFFRCIVATNIWEVVSTVLDTSMGADLESVARFWINNKTNHAVNVCLYLQFCGAYGNCVLQLLEKQIKTKRIANLLENELSKTIFEAYIYWL